MTFHGASLVKSNAPPMHPRDRERSPSDRSGSSTVGVDVRRSPWFDELLSINRCHIYSETTVIYKARLEKERERERELFDISIIGTKYPSDFHARNFHAGSARVRASRVPSVWAKCPRFFLLMSDLGPPTSASLLIWSRFPSSRLAVLKKTSGGSVVAASSGPRRSAGSLTEKQRVQ